MKTMKVAPCKLHPAAQQVVFCPACRGSVTSERKAAASRINGAKGGRPYNKSASRRAHGVKRHGG